MEEKTTDFVSEISVRWVKGESGNTYLCPVKALERLENPTEEELKKICVDESQNPQNS
ncbi:hypothetical protein GF324_05485 [bacterium]|nr:hypothetical protein [bacterium]